MTDPIEYPIEPRVIIDGVEIKPEQGGTDSYLFTGVPILLPGTVTFTWGRDAITDQPQQSTASFTIEQMITGSPGQVTLFTSLHTGSVVQVWSSEQVTDRDVLMWAGEITELEVTPANANKLTAAVSCTDASTIIGNIDVGDEPWPEETAYVRFQHILDAAGLRLHSLQPAGDTGWRWQLTGVMDDSLHGLQVAFRDVDKQPPLDLIQQLAATVGGIAWITADSTGPYIWIEDPTQRQGLRQFIVNAVTKQITIGQVVLDFSGVNQWDADDVVPRSSTWVQDPTQSVNVIDLTWQQPAGLNDQGNPAYSQATIEQVDSTSDKGVRAFSVDTELVRRADASQLAYHWLFWTHSADWLMSGLAIDTSLLTRQPDDASLVDRVSQVMDLLDVRNRIGYRLTITGLPDWAPAGSEQSYYIEGGTYSWTGGRWQLSLIATPNAIGGGATVRDLPDSKFSDFDASLRFIDIAGVAGPGGFPVGFGAGPFGAQPFGA